MSTTAVRPPPPPPATTIGDHVRTVLRGIGQLLITAGLVVLLFVVYEVWITNIFAARAQAKVAHAFAQQLIQGKNPLLPLPGNKDPAIPTGEGVANLYIPRLGRDYHYTIVQGSQVPNASQLAQGPAHYKYTALPGQLGNFAVAGHRVGKGEPFLNLDLLRAGDPVIVETERYWYVYDVKGTENGLSQPDADGVPGREIVEPSDGDVLLPLPDHPAVTQAAATERLMTMTTCHPKFSAARRMVVHAVLVSRVPVVATSGSAALSMPAAIHALYGTGS